MLVRPGEQSALKLPATEVAPNRCPELRCSGHVTPLSSDCCPHGLFRPWINAPRAAVAVGFMRRSLSLYILLKLLFCTCISFVKNKNNKDKTFQIVLFPSIKLLSCSHQLT